MWEAILPAPVYQATLEVHQIAGQNVPLTQNVQVTWPVSSKNAETLVQDHAELMPNVVLSTIHRSVVALKGIQEIRSRTVRQNHLHRQNLLKQILATHHLAVQMLSATTESAHVYQNIKEILTEVVDLNAF